MSYTKVKGVSDALAIKNPFGKAILEAFFDGVVLSDTLPCIKGAVTDNVVIYIWDLKDFHIELLKVNINPSLPPGMKVDCCLAFLWRFKTLSKKAHPKFSCRLKFIEGNLEGEPESGEGVIAQSWDNNVARITIATEDEEFLKFRAQGGKSLPVRLAANNLIVPDLVEYLEDGIQVSLPPFEANEEGQIQFIISWVKGVKKNNISTWFAVEISPQEILKVAGLKG